MNPRPGFGYRPGCDRLAGAVGMAFHPRFRREPQILHRAQSAQGGHFPSSVLQGLAAPDLKSDSGQPLKEIITFQGVTNSDHGGGLAFGPDGYLYVGMGDSGPGGDPEGHGQNLSTLAGKMLRIDVDHPDSAKAYSVPPDNPSSIGRAFVPRSGLTGCASHGVSAFDPVTHDLWVGERRSGSV